MSYVVCFQYLLNLQRFIQKCWILFSMVGLSFQSAIFGFTYGACTTSWTPVIKVQLHIICFGNWQTFQGDIWRGDPLSRALPLHQCYRILGRTPGGQLSISSKSIWEPNIMTWFWSSQGGWYIWHLWHLQPRLPWSRGTWSPWSPYHSRHYFCPASQK